MPNTLSNNNKDYLTILTDAAKLGTTHRDMRNTIMLRETFAELPDMVGIDHETVQDAYRAYRNAFIAKPLVLTN